MFTARATRLRCQEAFTPRTLSGSEAPEILGVQTPEMLL